MRSVNPTSPDVTLSDLHKYIRQPRQKLSKSAVMSQAVDHLEESSYMQDSFFVADDEEIVYSESEEDEDEEESAESCESVEVGKVSPLLWKL